MRKVAVTIISLLCLLAGAAPAVVGGSATFPDEIDLPDMFPEGTVDPRLATLFQGPYKIFRVGR